MTEWKTLDEILPEMGRAAEADPENWREQFEVLAEDHVSTVLSGYYLAPHLKYRRRPHTMKYTVERPEPMLEHPEMYQCYWFADPTSEDWAECPTWDRARFDLLMFNRGLCYATKEEAAAAAKAMVGG